MAFIAGAIIGSAIVGGVSAHRAGKRAAEATREGTAASVAVQEKGIESTERMYEQAREDLAPYREMGEEFIPKIKEFMRGDYGSFLESPDYKFTLEQGEQAIARKQSAAGARFGGKALKEAATFATGLAGQRVNEYFSKLFNITGMGQSAAAGSAQQALQTGTAQANIYGAQAATLANQGTNLANIAMQRGAGINQAVQSGIGNLTTLSMYNKMFPSTTPAG